MVGITFNWLTPVFIFSTYPHQPETLERCIGVGFFVNLLPQLGRASWNSWICGSRSNVELDNYKVLMRQFPKRIRNTVLTTVLDWYGIGGDIEKSHARRVDCSSLSLRGYLHCESRPIMAATATPIIDINSQKSSNNLFLHLFLDRIHSEKRNMTLFSNHFQHPKTDDAPGGFRWWTCNSRVRWRPSFYTTWVGETLGISNTCELCIIPWKPPTIIKCLY